MNGVYPPVLIEGPDHSYIKVDLVETKVVYNKIDKKFSEWVGDEYLQPNEITIHMLVAR